MIILINGGMKLLSHSQMEDVTGRAWAKDWQQISIPIMPKVIIDKLGDKILLTISEFLNEYMAESAKVYTPESEKINI